MGRMCSRLLARLPVRGALVVTTVLALIFLMLGVFTSIRSKPHFQSPSNQPFVPQGFVRFIPSPGDNNQNQHRWTRFVEERACAFDERASRLLDDNVVDGVSQAHMLELVGYYQSWRYFEHVREEVQEQFRFQDDTSRIAREFINSAISKEFGSKVPRSNVTLVGVHIRVRDMASNRSHQLGYTVAPPAYLHRAMRYFAEHFAGKKLAFVLCTDDADWVRNNNIRQPRGTHLIYRGGDSSIKQNGEPWRGRDVDDLALIAACDHVIMTVGTFGWWAAWLAGGITVYYKGFPLTNSYISGQFDAQDFYYPRWVGL